MNQDPHSTFVGKVLLRQSIGAVRLVIALFTVTATITKLLYNRFLPGLSDLDELRWSIIVLGCIFFVTTYLKFKRAAVVNYFSFFLYLVTLLYVIAFVVINRFDPNAVAILILVIGASTVIMNSLFYYGVQSAFIILAGLFAYQSNYLGAENLIQFFNLLIALAVFGIVVAVRLKLISSVRNSHANLEKLNVLSIVANKAGEIVFVSPSVQGLLGYEPHELTKEGWWNAGNLAEAWIDRAYILNYPNIIPKEIISIETKLKNKDGKTVWLSWANSLLPNGNYMGVALDITKYKNE
jgi:PAS domain S-box-containing protein